MSVLTCTFVHPFEAARQMFGTPIGYRIAMDATSDDESDLYERQVCIHFSTLSQHLQLA
jgi:extradiol dioxygenase family protein